MFVHSCNETTAITEFSKFSSNCVNSTFSTSCEVPIPEIYPGHKFNFIHQIFSSKTIHSNGFIFLKFKRCDLSFAKKNFLMINYTFFFHSTTLTISHVTFIILFTCNTIFGATEISFFLYEHFGRWWTISQKNKNKKNRKISTWNFTNKKITHSISYFL